MAVTGPIASDAMKRLFTATNCRTFRRFQPKDVPDSVLKALYDNVKFGPNAFNCNPMRVKFIRSPAAKERLLPFVLPGNVPNVKSAPVTALIGADHDFVKNLEFLGGGYRGGIDYFVQNPQDVAGTAMQNINIQIGYFILAARGLGLDVGPMAGFDAAGADKEFFSGQPVKSVLLVNLGYGDAEGMFDRSPRFEFEQACEIL